MTFVDENPFKAVEMLDEGRLEVDQGLSKG